MTQQGKDGRIFVLDRDDLPVVFHPAKAGSYHGTYKVTWTDRFGGHSLLVPITGTGVG